MIMKNKILLVIIIVLFVVGYGVFSSQVDVKPISDLALANVEALASPDEAGKCPDPYDVYNHQFGFVQRTGRYKLDANCEVTIAGKKFKIAGLSSGVTATLTYELGNCDKDSPGNCCPNSRIGEVRNITSN